MTNHEWALKYAEQGLVIFPVWWITEQGTCACGMSGCSEGKHPIIAGGFKHASREPSVIDIWFRKWPKANIGCLPGASGYVVLDLDGPQGMQSARQLGLLAEPTLEVQSGRVDGGVHRWYKHPGFPVANAKLAPGIDVRGDSGYVILPPSKHVSGKTYRWLGRFEEVIELPPAVEAQLKSPGTSLVVPAAAPAQPGQADALLLPAESIRDEIVNGVTTGGRNNALTRFAGRLFAKGLSLDEVQLTLLGVNQSACVPPLPVNEVLTICRSIHAAEVRSGVVRNPSGSPQEAVSPPAPTETLAEVRNSASEAAKGILARDPSQAVRWMWHEVDHLLGMMLPGETHLLGSLPGNGKTTLVMTQLERLRQLRVPTLYAPLEIDPALALLREACFILGTNFTKVVRGEWWALPEGTRDAVEELTEELSQDQTISYVPSKTLTGESYRQWLRKAKAEMGARVVVIDHFHRMSPGGHARDTRVSYDSLVRTLANIAREEEVIQILTVQLNRKENEGLDRYRPPTMERIKETAALGEEAYTVSMLSRALQASVSAADFTAVRNGQMDVSEIAAPNTMVLTCRKHRLDDGTNLDRSVRLRVDRGRVVDLVRDMTPRDNPTWTHN